MSSIKKYHGVVLVGVVLALAGCGGSDSAAPAAPGTLSDSGVTTTGGGTGTTTTGSTDSTASTIVLTYPITDSVENLGGGVYRRVGKAIVTDNEGNPVPDGTNVYFNVIDSIIAQGTITSGNGDGISGSVITDFNPRLANGVLTTFSTASVIRDEAVRYIQPGDHVYLKGLNSSFDANAVPNADAGDKNRIISTENGAISGNTLKVTQDYVSVYPNSTYATGVTDYMVGASLLGASVLGKTYNDAGEAQYVNLGYASTKNGIAEFVIDYSANERELNSGCGISDIDERSLPLGSAKVLVVASAGSKAITVDDRFCFEPVEPLVVAHDWNPVIDAGAAPTEWFVPVEVVDANLVAVPYERGLGIEPSTNSQSVHIHTAQLVDELGNPTDHLNRRGQVYVRLLLSADADAKSSDKGTIVVEAGEGSTSIEVSVLEGPPAAADGLYIYPSKPLITMLDNVASKTSSVQLQLQDSKGSANKTVYARLTYITNKGAMVVSLPNATYDTVLDYAPYTTDSTGKFTSSIKVEDGIAGDEAEITYFYGAFEVKVTIKILADL